MKRILLVALCLVFALTGVAMAQNVHISGTAKVFDIFGAVGATMTALEADGTTVIGDMPTGTPDICGAYNIDTSVDASYYRAGCYVHGDASYFGNLLHVIGNSDAFNIAVGAGSTTIPGVNVALY
jgi:hypothetical protein